MLLAIDAGNSFVKLGYHDGRDWSGVERVPLTEFAARADRWEGPCPGEVWIADVAGAPFREPFGRLAERWKCRVVWVEARERGCGVVNGYRRPAQLGADRWCALVAAHHLGPGAKVVVSAGTAVTIDALTPEGVFEGGLILPGIELMKRALAEHTSGVGLAPGQFEDFPRDTGNAVHTGAVLAIAGAVERMAWMLAQRGCQVEAVLTGGAAPQLAPLVRLPQRQVPHLVLEGLLCLAREEEAG